MPEIQKDFFALELDWFKRVLDFRILQSFNRDMWPESRNSFPMQEANKFNDSRQITDMNPPDPANGEGGYSELVKKFELDHRERLILLLALMPHVQPELLAPLISEKHPEYGGIKGKNYRGFIPTGQTALFLVGENDRRRQNELLEILSDKHKFHKANILSLEAAPAGEPELSGTLISSREITDIVTRGFVRPPDFTSDFPARRITTEMTWDDLVLAQGTKRQVEEVKIWLRHREKLFVEFGMGKRVKRGYKALFYGSPGTGKSLTACLLGQYTGRHVFRIDLSTIVSKYIGETEKNLAKVFDKAEHADWILFFDEADALFGSRTKVSSSHDRFANQEVSYLLQRIEDYNGIVLLASNMKSNIDDAFMRRFNSVVHFPFPKSEERHELWRRAIPSRLEFSADVDIKMLAERYEMSGANITNVVAWCALMALENGDVQITTSVLREGMARELAKEGRTL